MERNVYEFRFCFFFLNVVALKFLLFIILWTCRCFADCRSALVYSVKHPVGYNNNLKKYLNVMAHQGWVEIYTLSVSNL